MNTKMKMLSLALIGAFGYAGVAAADCPTDPVPPWSAKSTLSGTISIAEGGYDGTECRMDAALTGAMGFASAFVRDDSPASEETYRAQFLVNLDNLNDLGVSDVVRLFAATTEQASQGVSELVRITAFGDFSGSNKILGIATACADNPSGRCSTTATLPSSGEHRVEIAWEKGASGGVRVWINNTTETSPTASVTADNTAWGGVDSAVLGLTAASPGYLTRHLNKTVGFDQFDSRRTSFIGN